jgi:PEP-CTERM motif
MPIRFASGITTPRKSSLLIVTMAAGALALPAAASAETVTATFTGSVTSVFDSAGGLPSASEQDPLVATYVFDLANATGSQFIPNGGGEISGPYGSFVAAAVTVNGVVAGALPPFNSGELIGETNVFQTGSIVGVTLLGAGTSFESSVTGMDFIYALTPIPVAFSYNPTQADQTSIFLSDNAGDIIEGDISKVAITVAATTPPAVPEPSTWAMMALGFAGIGFAGSRARKRRPLAI